MKAKKTVRYVFIIVGTLIFANLVMLSFFESRIVYKPTREIKQTPLLFGINFEDVYLATADGLKINGWFISNNDSDKVFLVFHGNASNISEQMNWIRLYHVLPANIFIIDYHGYGKSQGQPSENNLYMDAKAAYDYLVKVKKFKPWQIIAVGNSLGGAVAIDLASKEKLGGVAVRSTFTSIPDIAVLINPFYRWPIIWFRNNFESEKKIGKINAPFIIFHSIEDEQMPYAMAVKLYKKARGPKKMWLVEKSEHDHFFPDPDYINGLKWLMGQAIPEAR